MKCPHCGNDDLKKIQPTAKKAWWDGQTWWCKVCNKSFKANQQ